MAGWIGRGFGVESAVVGAGAASVRVKAKVVGKTVMKDWLILVLAKP